MASLIAPAIGIAGSLLGGSKKSSGTATAAQQSLQGYNYLTGSGAGAPTVTSNQNQGVTAGNNQGVTLDAQGQLLGTAPAQDGTKNAFNNYLNSTGYQFQMDQGSKAITGSAAARGILNSGSTAKALQTYGQNTAQGSFNNYLNQLTNLSGQQGNVAARGLTAAQITGQAGTTGGGNAGQVTQSGANASGDAITTAAGIGAAGISNNASKINNWFGA